MQPDDLYDALYLPLAHRPVSGYSLATTKSRAGQGKQGMTVESESVSLVPRNPMWPPDAYVHPCHKKDSIVSSASSKGKGKARDSSMSSAATTTESPVSAEEARRSSEVPAGYWSTRKYGSSSDDEGSDISRSTTSTSSFSAFLDANCRPMGSQLAQTTSQISRFSAYGLTAPGSRRASSATGSRRASAATCALAPDGDPGGWWLEKKPRLSSTFFVSPAGRRASRGFDYGTVGAMPLSRRASSGLCKRCFYIRESQANVNRDTRGWKRWWAEKIGLVLANAIFPLTAGGLALYSFLHPENLTPGILAIIPFTVWMIFLAICFKLWKPSPPPKCTCANLSWRRVDSPLLQKARQDLDELERWRWERRPTGRKASEVSPV